MFVDFLKSMVFCGGYRNEIPNGFYSRTVIYFTDLGLMGLIEMVRALGNIRNSS